MVPGEDLGESQETESGLPYATSIHLPALEQLCLACLCLRGFLCSCAADTEPPVPKAGCVPCFPANPACSESAEGPWGRQGTSFGTVKIILNKK